ncbi:MAG: AbrB/MazE/SpoVT family DNA-binding domain-containing protein [Chloroflexota bacterium]
MSIEIRVTRIGNSRGVRLPAETLRRLGVGDVLLMEERSDGILLRPVDSSPPKLSLEETAVAIAAAEEDWSDWDDTLADGLDDLPWDHSSGSPRDNA